MLKEGSSVLPSMKNVTPSERSRVSETEGVGDLSEFGRSPESGQKKIWGNLANQSRGMVGVLDTQGKSAPELFTDRRGVMRTNDPGTYTPGVYQKMYTVHESANGGETGQKSGKLKVTGVNNHTGTQNKYVRGADIVNGGSCNCKNKPMTESQLVGSTIALFASKVLSEGYGTSR